MLNPYPRVVIFADRDGILEPSGTDRLHNLKVALPTTPLWLVTRWSRCDNRLCNLSVLLETEGTWTVARSAVGRTQRKLATMIQWWPRVVTAKRACVGSVGTSTTRRHVGMSDPNAIYKAGFQALADKLGRIPTSRDEGWLALHNEYSRSYGEERDMRLAEERKARAAGPGEEGFSRQPAPQARTIDDGLLRWSCGEVVEPGESYQAHVDKCLVTNPSMRARTREAAGEPLSGPGAAGITSGAPSEPVAPSAAPPVSDGLSEGDRGPGGGLVGKCGVCGRLWERPARRGRPAFKCGECR